MSSIHSVYADSILGEVTLHMGVDPDLVAEVLEEGVAACRDRLVIDAICAAAGISFAVYGVRECEWFLWGDNVQRPQLRRYDVRRAIIDDLGLEKHMHTPEAIEFFDRQYRDYGSRFWRDNNLSGGLTNAYWINMAGTRYRRHASAKAVRSSKSRQPAKPSRSLITQSKGLDVDRVRSIAPTIDSYRERYEAGDARTIMARELGVSTNTLRLYAFRHGWRNPLATGSRRTVK